MKRVITTVGTSLFRKYDEYKEEKHKINDINDLVKGLRNQSYKEWKCHEGKIEHIRDILFNWAKDKRNASAEITSILEIQKELKKAESDEEIEVYLIATDTILSALAAKIIQDIFDEYYSQNMGVIVNFNKQDVILGLQVKNKNKFEKDGLVNFLNKLNEKINYDYENTILNITGGYKAVIPYMTILGQVNNMPIYYIFEDTDELLKIPQAPISINWGIFEKYNHIFKELTDLNIIEEPWAQYKMKNNLDYDFSFCIEEIEDGAFCLNAIGKMFWDIYNNCYIISIPQNTKYSRENKDKKKQLNSAFHELCKRLENLSEPFEILTDKLLKHKVIKDTVIYKHASPQQIRIQYKYKDKHLTIFNYFFINSERNHINYSKWMEDEYDDLKGLSTKFITIKK